MTNDKKTYLILDGSNIAYRAYFAMKGLSTEGRGTSAIYGFLNILNSVVGKFKPTKVYVCWDGLKSPHRLKIHPEYKMNRKTAYNPNFDAEDFHAQKEAIKKFIYYLGISQVHDTQMEADDLIYILAKKYDKKGNKIIIVSTDKDFNQLISSRIRVWNDNRKELLSPLNLRKFYGYEPQQTVDYLCLLGDTSDNIPGVRGMGEVRTIKFLDEYSSIETFLEEASTFGSISAKLIKEAYTRNRELIDLKYFYEKYHKGKVGLTFFKDKSKPKLNLEKYLKLCKTYRFQTVRTDEFLSNFKRLSKTNG